MLAAVNNDCHAETVTSRSLISRAQIRQAKGGKKKEELGIRCWKIRGRFFVRIVAPFFPNTLWLLPLSSFHPLSLFRKTKCLRILHLCDFHATRINKLEQFLRTTRKDKKRNGIKFEKIEIEFEIWNQEVVQLANSKILDKQNKINFYFYYYLRILLIFIRFLF